MGVASVPVETPETSAAIEALVAQQAEAILRNAQAIQRNTEAIARLSASLEKLVTAVGQMHGELSLYMRQPARRETATPYPME